MKDKLVLEETRLRSNNTIFTKGLNLRGCHSKDESHLVKVKLGFELTRGKKQYNPSQIRFRGL